ETRTFRQFFSRAHSISSGGCPIPNGGVIPGGPIGPAGAGPPGGGAAGLGNRLAGRVGIGRAAAPLPATFFTTPRLPPIGVRSFLNTISVHSFSQQLLPLPD